MVVAPAAGAAAAAAPTAATSHGSKTPGALPGVAAQPAEAGQGDPGAAAAAPQNRRCGSALPRGTGADIGAAGKGVCLAAGLALSPTGAVTISVAVAVNCGAAC